MAPRKSTPAHQPQQYVQRSLLPFVIGFGVLALVVIGMAVYTAFAKTSITVSVVPAPAEQAVEVAIEDLGIEPIELDITDEYVYSDLQSEAVVGEEQATGTVTIYNNYSADQRLVSTTRLLSESGVLFRTNEDVTVPAGGTVEVEVYADEAGEAGEIEPTKFEIVALNATKKADIYAESSEPMTGGVRTAAIVTEADIETAITAAQEQFTTAVDTAIEDKLKEMILAEPDMAGLEYNANYTNITESTVESSPAVGEETDKLTVTTTATVRYLPIVPATIATKVSDQLGYTVPEDQLTYEVAEDAKTVTVTTEVAEGSNDDPAAFIDTTQLINKSADAIRTYLLSFPQVKDVQVRFSPFWVNTTSDSMNQIQLTITE